MRQEQARKSFDAISEGIEKQIKSFGVSKDLASEFSASLLELKEPFVDGHFSTGFFTKLVDVMAEMKTKSSMFAHDDDDSDENPISKMADFNVVTGLMK